MRTQVTGAGPSRTALIGRDHPARMLRAEIARAAESHGGLVLVTGEAGIGKTTLVTDAAEEARRQGALVLSGSCWDSDSAPGYWPWVQVIRGLRRHATPEERTAAEAVAGSGLAVLLGEAQGADGADGFQLYDAVTTALVSVAQNRPVVVVLDDLHWADTASLKLLEFAAQHTWFERLLLIGTYRDVEVESVEHPLQPLITPLVAKATTVTLTGLSRDEVGALMARTAGEEPAAELVAEVHRRTGGNPFFVEQTARLWHSGSALTAIAPGVRDALQRRLSLLPQQVTQLLVAAAVLGQEFHRQVLAATAGAPVPVVDRLLDQAVAARLVVVLGAGRFGFAHDLVRETLYASLDEAEARQRHAAVVRALDRSPALSERILAADLARHAYLAGAELDQKRAVDLLLAAAREAGSRMALEEAIGHYRRAWERAADDPHRRVRVALDLGREMHHAGDRDDAWRVLDEAVEATRQLDDPELLARVALTCYSVGTHGERDQLRADLLAEAHLALLGEGTASSDDEPPSLDRLARDLSIRVTALARNDDDDEALTFWLWAQHDAIWGLGTAAERAGLTDELITIARRRADLDLEHFATSLRWVALLELGDPAYREMFHAFVAMAERERLPRFIWASFVDRCIIFTVWGRFADAESCLDQATEAFAEHTHPHFAYMADHLRWALQLRQGQFEELGALHHALVEHEHPYAPMLEGITALERGDTDAARRLFVEHKAGPDPFPRSFGPLGLRFQAHLAAATRDPQLCEQSRAELAPHTGQWLVSIYGCDISGPVDLWLGLLDAAQERWTDAIAKLTAARTSADRLQARPWSIEARTYLARTLLARGDDTDVVAAERLLDEVETEAAEIGMRQILDRVEQARSGTPACVPAPEAAAPAGGPANGATNQFWTDGEVWSLGFAGQVVHLPDAKGLRDVHALLSQPGVEIPAAHLLNPGGGAVVTAARQLGGDPVLDDEAKAQYKRRLTQLDDEIDRAAGRGDDHRVRELDRERQALLAELRAAAGLAGRTRRLGDEAERARKTVSARIRDALRKLDERHPALAAHLRAAVSTGVTCSYQPDQEIRWQLQQLRSRS